MTKFEIGSLVALAVAIIGGAVAFGNLQGRVAAIENVIEAPVKQIQEEGEKIKEDLRNASVQKIIQDLQKSSVPKGTIAAFVQNVCPNGWSEMDGTNQLPDFRGRFLVGVGPYSQDQERELRLGQRGGSHRMRIKAYGNEAKCCSGDRSIIQLNVEWMGEGEVAVEGHGDGHKEQRKSRWMNHFPPYVAVRWCMKK